MQKTDYTKEFISIFDKFRYKYPKWKVWNDFLYLSAVSMANLIPTAERKEREKRYQAIWNSYPVEYRELMPQLLAVVIAALDENPEQDFLGSLYHRLELHQQQKGQFFTPYHVSHLMAELQFAGTDLDELKSNNYISVNDPACGAGAMLIAFANVAKSHGINYQKNVLFIAQDIDQTAALMCYIQLAFLGCPAVIIVGDSLLKPDFHPDNTIWYTPFFWMNQWKFRDVFGNKEVPDNEIAKNKQKKKKMQRNF